MKAQATHNNIKALKKTYLTSRHKILIKYRNNLFLLWRTKFGRILITVKMWPPSSRHLKRINRPNSDMMLVNMIQTRILSNTNTSQMERFPINKNIQAKNLNNRMIMVMMWIYTRMFDLHIKIKKLWKKMQLFKQIRFNNKMSRLKHILIYHLWEEEGIGLQIIKMKQ